MLEESKERLIISISTDQRELQQLENKILGLLRDARGNLLDDESLITALNSAKAKSGERRAARGCLAAAAPDLR